MEENNMETNMDEASIIREQERLAKLKKKKKYKRIKTIALILVLILVAGGTWYMGWGKNLLSTETEDTEVTIECDEGQQTVFAKLTAVNGNEITYTVCDAVVTEETTDETSDRDFSKGDTSGNDMHQGGGHGGKQDADTSGNDRGEMPSMDSSSMPSMDSSSMPSMDSSSMPSMDSSSMPSMDSSSMPSMGGGDMGGFGGGMPGDFSGFSGMGSTTQSSSASVDAVTYDDVTYIAGTESNTTYIPVGTTVTTKLGTETTFSRLQAGDYVAIVMEDDIIVRVYIIG